MRTLALLLASLAAQLAAAEPGSSLVMVYALLRHGSRNLIAKVPPRVRVCDRPVGSALCMLSAHIVTPYQGQLGSLSRDGWC